MSQFLLSVIIVLKHLLTLTLDQPNLICDAEPFTGLYSELRLKPLHWFVLNPSVNQLGFALILVLVSTINTRIRKLLIHLAHVVQVNTGAYNDINAFETFFY